MTTNATNSMKRSLEESVDIDVSVEPQVPADPRDDPYHPIFLGVPTVSKLSAFWQMVHSKAVAAAHGDVLVEPKAIVVFLLSRCDVDSLDDIGRSRRGIYMINYQAPGLVYERHQNGHFIGVKVHGCAIGGKRFRSQVNLRNRQAAVICSGDKMFLSVREFELHARTPRSQDKVPSEQRRRRRPTDYGVGETSGSQTSYEVDRRASEIPYALLNNSTGSYPIQGLWSTSYHELYCVTETVLLQVFYTIDRLNTHTASAIKDIFIHFHHFVMGEPPDDYVNPLVSAIRLLSSGDDVSEIVHDRARKRSRISAPPALILSPTKRPPSPEPYEAGEIKESEEDDDSLREEEHPCTPTSEVQDPGIDDAKGGNINDYLARVPPQGHVLFSSLEVLCLQLFSKPAIAQYARTLASESRVGNLMMSVDLRCPRIYCENQTLVPVTDGAHYMEFGHCSLIDVPKGAFVLSEQCKPNDGSLLTFFRSNYLTHVWYCDRPDPRFESRLNSKKDKRMVAKTQQQRRSEAGQPQEDVRSYKHSTEPAYLYHALLEGAEIPLPSAIEENAYFDEDDDEFSRGMTIMDDLI